MEAKELETKMHVWVRRMSILSYGKNTTELFQKICKGERKLLWQDVITAVRPSCEVEHVKKNLALKKASLKMKLKKQLQEREETTRIMEHDCERSSQRLRILNCNVQAIKQSTKELGMKTMLLCCKKQDMEHKAMMYEQLSRVTNFLKQPSSFGSGDPTFSHDKHMETIFQNVINKAELQVRELHNLYRTSDVNLQAMHTKKESVVQFVRHSMKDIPVIVVWQTMVNIMNKLNSELRDLIQSNIGNKSQQFVLLKEKTDAELHRFMLSYLELLKPYHHLQQKITAHKSECNVLLDKAVEILQEKLYPVKLAEANEETVEIRLMLELEMKIAELRVVKMIFQNEIKNMKVKQPLSLLTDMHEEEINQLDVKIEQLEADIKTNYVWLKKSYSNHSKAHECLQQLLVRLPKMCSLDKYGITNLDITMKEQQSSFQQEFKEFMELPLHVFDNLTLPSGVTLPRSQQILKYNINLAELVQSNDLPNILTILSGAPSAPPHSIVLQTLQNKLYLEALTSAELNSNIICMSSDNINVNSMQQTENVSIALITDVIDSLKASISRCKTITDRAESNFSAWVEHPLQHAVPEKLKLHEKTLRQWQDCYNSLLASVGDFEVEDFNINVQ